MAELGSRAKREDESESSLREARKIIAQHDSVDARWFAYEVDLATLLDFPMMIDMREQLTVEFHAAKARADLLKPTKAEELAADSNALERYRDAVHSYATAFAIAEAEARRRRRGSMSPLEQDKLARAQRLLALANDEGASSGERQSAYVRLRRELDGLIDIPKPAAAALESKVAGALGA